MKWSILLVRIAGIEIRMHLTFLLLLAWIGLSYYLRGGAAEAVSGLVFILLLFLCVLLHELGHAMAARAFGIPTPDITLLPIGGVARLQRMPDQPWQELIVAIAGPLVNVVIAAGLLAYVGMVNPMLVIASLEDPGLPLTVKLAAMNIWLVMFNLIPAFPMDGGRVLRSCLAMLMPYARATQIAARIGQGLAFVFAFIGLFAPNPIFVLIALFVYLGAQQEASLAQLKDVSEDLTVADAMVTHVLALPRDAALDEAADALLRTSQHEFPVVDELGRPLGLLTRDGMIAALKRHGPRAPVAEFMQRDLPFVTPHESFAHAFQKMQECSCPALPVIDREGRLSGLITTENVGELMLVRSLLPANGRPAWRSSPAV